MFNYITIKANNFIAAAILHGSINAAAGLAVIPLTGSTPLLTGLTGLAGKLGFLVLNLLILFFGKPEELLKKEFFV